MTIYSGFDFPDESKYSLNEKFRPVMDNIKESLFLAILEMQAKTMAKMVKIERYIETDITISGFYFFIAPAEPF